MKFQEGVFLEAKVFYSSTFVTDSPTLSYSSLNNFKTIKNRLFKFYILSLYVVQVILQSDLRSSRSFNPIPVGGGGGGAQHPTIYFYCFHSHKSEAKDFNNSFMAIIHKIKLE